MRAASGAGEIICPLGSTPGSYALLDDMSFGPVGVFEPSDGRVRWSVGTTVTLKTMEREELAVRITNVDPGRVRFVVSPSPSGGA